MTAGVERRYRQKDYLADEKTLPKVNFRQEMKEVSKDMTKRTLAEKAHLWDTYAKANIAVAKKKAAKAGVPTEWRRFLSNYLHLYTRFMFKPCLVVGYGPSFHDNIQKLKLVDRKKCNIIASERCLPEMFFNGIMPDAVVNLDSGDQVRWFYQGGIMPYIGHLVALGIIEEASPKTYAITKKGMSLPIVEPKTQKDLSHVIAKKLGWIDNRHRLIIELVKNGTNTPEGIGRHLNIDPYAQIPTHGLIGLFALTTNPDVRKWFRGHIFWFNPMVYPYKNTFSYDMQKETGLGVVPTAGNVGTTSLCLAVSLGAQPIGLLGMDFSHRVKGFDPSRLAVTEYTTMCPKCGQDHRAILNVPKVCRCQNEKCGEIFSPFDEHVRTYCTNASYKAYAFSTRTLLTTDAFGNMFKSAKIVNLSEGILHGNFIARGSIDQFILSINRWNMDEDMKRISAAIAKGARPRNNSFAMKSNVIEDEDGSRLWVPTENRWIHIKKDEMALEAASSGDAKEKKTVPMAVSADEPCVTTSPKTP